MKPFTHIWLLAALVVGTSSVGCGKASDEGTIPAGGTVGSGGSTSQGGSPGHGGVLDGGSSALGGEAGGTSPPGGAEAGGAGGSGSGNDGGQGGTSGDQCGGCLNAGTTEICIYQAGGPGPGRFVCATQNPCGAAGACACIVGQGTCDNTLMGGGTAGYCVCDNGLD